MPAARHPRQAHERPPESSGLSAGGRVGKSRENLRELAGHRGIALLNDGLSCEGHFRTSSGRIAQLVEQLTLNQRVPGSSPGAPTIGKLLFSKTFERETLRKSGSRAALLCRRIRPGYCSALPCFLYLHPIRYSAGIRCKGRIRSRRRIGYLSGQTDVVVGSSAQAFT